MSAGQENTIMVPKAPFITSNEQIFPSLHPFGPRYSQRPINGKRSADVAFSLQKTLEPRKMIHSPVSDEENAAQSPSQELKTEEIERSGFKVPKLPQVRRNTENKSLGVIENDTRDSRLVNNGLSYGSFALLQSLSFLMNPERLHMEMVKQALQMNFQTLFINQASKTSFDTMGNQSVLTAPESEKSESPRDQESCSDCQNLDEKETLDESSIVLPGFNDRNEVQVFLDPKVQAVIPKFASSPKDKSGRRSPKLVWNADIEKTGEFEAFHAKVEELLEISISDQQKVSQILKEYDYDVAKALGKIEKSKGRYRFAFKIKRNITSKPTQDSSKSE